MIYPYMYIHTCIRIEFFFIRIDRCPYKGIFFEPSAQNVCTAFVCTIIASTSRTDDDAIMRTRSPHRVVRTVMYLKKVTCPFFVNFVFSIEIAN